MFDINELLSADHIVSGEASVANYPSASLALQETLRATLAKKYGLPADFRLHEIHTYLPAEQVAKYLQHSGHWTDPLQTLGAPMEEAYHRFLGWLCDRLGTDFVFEKNPLVRYHIPARTIDRYRLADGRLFTHHSDTMLGDYFQQINCWLPFCDVRGTGALSVCSKALSIDTLTRFTADMGYDYQGYKNSRATFFDYAGERPELVRDIHENTMPINLRYGQLLMFDPRTLHGTAENIENLTRVSMDFRIVPLAPYEVLIDELELSGADPNIYDGDRLIRGEFYHARTASEATATAAA